MLTTRSERAWQAFRARVAELGGMVVEPTWLGSGKSHRVICSAGHECQPRPNSVQQGLGLCLTCVGRDSQAAEQEFRQKVQELEGIVLEPAWLGSDHPHRVRCQAGHECSPRPASVKQGHGLCRICVGLDPRTAEQAFRARVAELGGTLLEPAWRGVNKPHRVLCSAGHECSPHPSSVMRGRQGLCRTCGGCAPAVAEQAFRARVAELGGTPLYDKWLGANSKHRVRCADGHECRPYPSKVRDGGGLCRQCSGKIWDVFYLVESDEDRLIKFGITSGDPRPRLKRHSYDGGFTTVIRLLTGLPDDVAPSMERAVKATLRLAGEKPVRGREYFHARVLATVLDVVDHYPVSPAVPAQRGRVFAPQNPQ